MAIEWKERDRGSDEVDAWTYWQPLPNGTGIWSEINPHGRQFSVHVAWRLEVQLSSKTLMTQIHLDCSAPTAEVAKATAERVIHSLQQIAHDNPGILQKLHFAAT